MDIEIMRKKLVSLTMAASMLIMALAGCGNGTQSISQQTGNAGSSSEGGTDSESGAMEMADASEVSGTTISFWHSMGGVNGEAINTLVEKFNSENEYGITVDAQYQGEYDDAINKLKSAQIGNMGADLVQHL